MNKYDKILGSLYDNYKRILRDYYNINIEEIQRVELQFSQLDKILLEVGEASVTIEDLIKTTTREGVFKYGAIAYIRQWYSLGYRYHLVFCSTLKSMRSQGRSYRYTIIRPEKVLENSFMFDVVIGGHEFKKSMLPCLNCLYLLEELLSKRGLGDCAKLIRRLRYNRANQALAYDYLQGCHKKLVRKFDRLEYTNYLAERIFGE